MQTSAYEQVLRGHQSVQPLRNDALRGLGGTKEFGVPALALAAGLGIYAYMKGPTVTVADQMNKKLQIGGAFLAGWLLGGGALQY